MAKNSNNCSKYYTYNSTTKFCEPICIASNNIGYNNAWVYSYPSDIYLKQN